MDHHRITTNLLRKLQQLISKKLLEGTNIRVDEREGERERERAKRRGRGGERLPCGCGVLDESAGSSPISRNQQKTVEKKKKLTNRLKTVTVRKEETSFFVLFFLF